MTTEEKARRYDEAIKRANELLYVSDKESLQCKIIESILPELAESEDERIRIELLNYLYDVHDDDEERARWIAYLEKQGEHANFRKKIQIGDKVTRNRDSVLVNLSQLNRVAKKDEKQGKQETLCDKCKKEQSSHSCQDITELGRCALEKQDEQKPADKVEPKFKIEEEKWYVCTQTYVLRGKIVVIKGQTYQAEKDNVIKGENGCLFIDRHDGKALDYFRLWTIQDAKDRDVLVNKDASYIVVFKRFTYSEDDIDRFKSYFHCREGIFSSIENVGWCCNGFHPATKEQRDQLEKAMADAGYEWDAEKKELKKIEKKPINKVEPKFKVGQTIKKEGFNLGFTIVKIEDSFYYNDIGDYFPFTDQDNWELVESAWSEEDEEMFDYALDMVEWYSGKNESKSRTVSDWLKSLKDRVQPQPKQGWSEEDDIMVHDIDYALRCQIAYPKPRLNSMSSWIYKLKNRIQPKYKWSKEDTAHYNRILKELTLQKEMPINVSVIEEVKSDIIWFKSFKDRVQLQTTWKPSDEQLEYLLTIKTLSPSPLLKSLYIDLKKLREK